MADNHGFTLNADNFINRLVRSRWISLLAALFFLSGQWVNADPVGDFFKKVGQSVSKAFQPQPQPAHPQTEKTRVARRATSRKSNAATPAPSAIEEPSQPAKKQEKICPMEFRSQVGKAWSQALTYRREITSMSALLRLGQLCEIHTQESFSGCRKFLLTTVNRIFRGQ